MTDSSGRDGEFESPDPERDREGNRFSRRMQRYARVGGNVGGVAARIGCRTSFSAQGPAEKRDRSSPRRWAG